MTSWTELTQTILPRAGEARLLLLVEEAAHGLAAAEELAGQVRVDDAPPLVERHVAERRVLLEPRVRDQDVEAAERLGGLGEEILDLGLVAHVGAQRHRLAARAPDLLHDPLGRLAPGAVVHRDLGAGGGQGQGHALADAGAGARDDRCLAVQAHARLAV